MVIWGYGLLLTLSLINVLIIESLSGHLGIKSTGLCIFQDKTIVTLVNLTVKMGL